MAKLTALAALFLALIAGASAYTTVVTTTILDEENPQQSCQRQIQEMRRMRHCMQYMQSGRPYEASFLRSAVANPRFREEQVEECCGELRNFRPECRCDALRKVMRDMQEEYGVEAQMEEMMREKARSLPRTCRMGSPSECPFRAVFI